MSSGGGGGGQSTNTITKADPWSGIQPYLTGGQGYVPNYSGQGGSWIPAPSTQPTFNAPTQGQLLGTQPYPNQPSPQMSPASAPTSSPLGGLVRAFLPNNSASDAVRNIVPPSSSIASNTAGLYPALENYFTSGGPQFFPGQTYVNQSPETQTALGLQSQRALMGSPLEQASQMNALQTLQGQGLGANPAFGYLGQTASGGMLNANPYIDQAFNRAAGQINANTGSVFEKAGRYGSGAHAETLGRTLGDTANQFYGQNYANERQNQLAAANTLGQAYQDERQNQMGALTLAPGLAQQDYANISQLGNVGQQREAFAGQQLQDAMNRFNYYQQQPFNMLQQYSSILSPGLGIGGTSSSTSQQPTYSNPIAGALGGGVLGYGLGTSSLGAALGLTGPWGALGGAALGYLGSR